MNSPPQEKKKMVQQTKDMKDEVLSDPILESPTKPLSTLVVTKLLMISTKRMNRIETKWRSHYQGCIKKNISRITWSSQSGGGLLKSSLGPWL